MADYNHTINLCRDRVPDEGDLAQREPAMVRAGEQRGTYRSCGSWRAGGRLRAARRAAVRHRAFTSVTPSTNPQGHRGQVAARSAGFDSPTSPLGLPRAADRAAGGEKARPPRPEAATRRPFVPPPPYATSRSDLQRTDSSGSAFRGLGTGLTSPCRRATAQQLRASAASSVTDTSTRA